MISEYPCSSSHASAMHDACNYQLQLPKCTSSIFGQISPLISDIYSYAVKFDIVQHHRARRRVNMTNTDIDVQQVLFIC